MKLIEYDFHLPKRLIAQYPNEIRDQSRLLIVNRVTEKLTDTVFDRLPDYLDAGDCLVVNDSGVYPARIYGKSSRTGRRHEIVLVNHIGENKWRVLINRSRNCKVQDKFIFDSQLEATILDKQLGGVHLIELNDELTHDKLMTLGEMALPPYILKLRDHREQDKETYQTVYSKGFQPDVIPEAGSIAAPTAGLHFTPSLIERLKKKE